MRVRMNRTRNLTPPENRRITVKYLGEQEYTVKREWGDALVADGDAEEIDPPSRDAFNGADPAAFDHDGDGKPGGRRRKPKTSDVVGG